MILFTPIKEESQRVPHKNFRQFCGRPLYEYVLQKLNCYPIYVDTDSNKIIENIKTNPDLSHVVAYKRETNLVGHEVSVCSLIESLISRWNIKEPVCQFHVTSPFIKLNTLLEALTSLLQPVLILILGGAVGFIALAVLLPMLDMSQILQ